jgi:hypothetical protein
MSLDADIATLEARFANRKFLDNAPYEVLAEAAGLLEKLYRRKLSEVLDGPDARITVPERLAETARARF